jgi:biotin carboxyl carrier protein
MFAAGLESDGMGLATRHQGEEIHYAYPIAILMSSASTISKESKVMKNYEAVDSEPELGEDGPVLQGRAQASPADAPPRPAAPLLAAVPIALAIVTFLFWYLTWFGRPLRDSEMDQYLTEASVPHKTQHALAQLAERMAHGDPAARRWYPLVLKLAENEQSGLRAMSAWVMGQDNQSEAFHAELRRLLEDPEPAVRSNAALALVRFHDAAGEPQLRLMLRPYALAAPETGRVSYRVKEGGAVTTGSVVARIDAGDRAPPLEARSPLAGQVERRTRTEGATVTAGDEIAVLSPGEEQVWESLRALFLVGQAADLQDVERLALVAPGVSERVRQQAALTAQAIRRRAVASDK